ncbi:MAG: L,D-transpeptidase [Ignavibacteriales bacterium]
MIKFNLRAFLLNFYGLLILIITASTINCSENPKNVANSQDQSREMARRDSITVNSANTSTAKDTVYKYVLPRPVRYSAYPVKGTKALSELYKKYGTEGGKLILALNRLDESNIRRTDTLVIPDTITNIISYSPFPYEIQAVRSVPKLILISRRIQAFAAYENGVLVKWGPTSTGRKSKPTPEGLFNMNWKSRKTTSTIDSSWILPYYFNFYNKEGVALHQFSMPGYPASHACVRLLENDARWFYYWAEQWMLSDDGGLLAQGTPLIVFDEYRFGKRKPWKNLLENPDALKISDSEISELMNKYLPTILERNEKRQEAKIALKNKAAESSQN